MLTFVLSYLGGVLTIFSPCVLPVVPFVFARSDQPFRKSGLPMLVGMGISFASFAALSVAGGRWVIQASQIGRILALVIFTILGLSLLFSRFAERLAQPLVRLGGILQKRADARPGIGSSLLLGASVGLLWAPCAGPILGLVLAGASLGKSTQNTFFLLLAFAMGAATSLGIAIFAGGKVLRTLKKGLFAEEWIKRAIGVAVLGAVIAIALGLDTKFLATLSYVNTNKIEQSLVDLAAGNKAATRDITGLSDEGPAPSLEGATQWLNSAPLTLQALRGKVVLIDFWTYSCINCLRTLPYLKAWAEKYRNQGLVVIGVHAPEFAFEKDLTNVKKAVRDLGITYPVAIDNDQILWSAFRNQYWPAHYFIDANGHVRYHHFGEGDYEESERVIQELLKEAHGGKPSGTTAGIEGVPVTASSVKGTGIEAAPGAEEVLSPETYLGYERQEGFSSTPDIEKDGVRTYHQPSHYRLNQWGLSGSWKITGEKASLRFDHGQLAFRFHARDVHLVMGNPEGKAIRFRVTIDGKPPGNDHGEDTDQEGYGTVKSHRLYQLVRQKRSQADHTVLIEFFDSGVEVFAFTFG
ncbi:MAG: cytochrome c biogenesis protein DipZ [Oligoflexia bacterium]|nr:cytochrome c biogenesis protein DipZ [Oligoflexia bacterium]